MTIAFQDIALTTITTSRTLAGHLSRYVNVRDFGAVGNGSTDDSGAIQAAFTEAWGTVASPKVTGNIFPVYIPAGNYAIANTLHIPAVRGTMLMGAGSYATRLTYTGSIPGEDVFGGAVANSTVLLMTHGLADCIFQGFSLAYGTAQNLTNPCFSFVITRQAGDPGGVQLTLGHFIDIRTLNATTGIVFGINSNIGCDNLYILNCEFTDHYYSGANDGGNQNTLANNFMNCRFTRCGVANPPNPAQFGAAVAGKFQCFVACTFIDSGGADFAQDAISSTQFVGCRSATNAATFTVASGGYTGVILPTFQVNGSDIHNVGCTYSCSVAVNNHFSIIQFEGGIFDLCDFSGTTGFLSPGAKGTFISRGSTYGNPTAVAAYAGLANPPGVY